MDLPQLRQALLELSEDQREELISGIKPEKRSTHSSLSELLKERERSEATVCPKCRGENYISKGHVKGVRKYQCKDCGRNFSSTSNTALYWVHKKDKWEAYLKCMEDGLSIRKAAARVGISTQTAFNWRHKVLERLGQLHAEKLEGVVEADEMFVMDSQKGAKQLDRPARKRGGKRIGGDTVSVLVGLDRKGHLIVKNTGKGKLKKAQLNKAFSGKIDPEAIFCTDGLPAFKGFAKREKLVHKQMIAVDKERVKDKAFHIQTVNATHAQIRDILRRHKGVATKYLQNYLNWFVAQKSLADKANAIAFWLTWSVSSQFISQASYIRT